MTDIVATLRQYEDDAINAAAVRWCGNKDRETSMDDILYFRNNWSALPGLKRYVEEEIAARARAVLRAQPDPKGAKRPA